MSTLKKMSTEDMYKNSLLIIDLLMNSLQEDKQQISLSMDNLSTEKFSPIILFGKLNTMANMEYIYRCTLNNPNDAIAKQLQNYRLKL